ncbi:hypothetical protein Scep_015364 [Stephania cephalantha]|uniref:Uncharacterized protein n=1 Tax=Stephania cephalantha TaxID=152367 RepID=A0AAP0P1B0_9MAGN
MKMSEFLKKMKDISDCLATAGSPILVYELISFTLTGLDSEYLPITTVLEHKDDLSWQDLQSTLLGFESKLEQLQNIAGINFNKELLNPGIILNKVMEMVEETISLEEKEVETTEEEVSNSQITTNLPVKFVTK